MLAGREYILVKSSFARDLFKHKEIYEKLTLSNYGKKDKINLIYSYKKI